jgi:hypothetical protein
MQTYTITMIVGTMIVGAAIYVASYVFAFITIIRQARAAFHDDLHRFSARDTAVSHLTAMIGMAIGGNVFFVGLIMFLVQLFG